MFAKNRSNLREQGYIYPGNGLDHHFLYFANKAPRVKWPRHFKGMNANNLSTQSLTITNEVEDAMQIITLDSMELQGKIKLIKIDVEGMELEVLKGGSRTLMKHKPVLYLEAGDKESFLRLNEFLGGLNYKYQTTFNVTPTPLFIHENDIQ